MLCWASGTLAGLRLVLDSTLAEWCLAGCVAVACMGSLRTVVMTPAAPVAANGIELGAKTELGVVTASGAYTVVSAVCHVKALHCCTDHQVSDLGTECAVLPVSAGLAMGHCDFPQAQPETAINSKVSLIDAMPGITVPGWQLPANRGTDTPAHRVAELGMHRRLHGAQLHCIVVVLQASFLQSPASAVVNESLIVHVSLPVLCTCRAALVPGVDSL